MKKVTIDYIFPTSPKLLYKRLSTASGLNEWFADNVTVDDNTFTFEWQGYEQVAKFKNDRKNMCIKFDWLDDDKEYLQFNLEKSDMSKATTLYITDFVEDDETEEDAREFWDNQIRRLKRKLGIKA
jgi:uncharacterized protein YndB with AHSA1/START domain